MGSSPPFSKWSQPRQEEFAVDMCNMFVSCGLPWHTVENPQFQQFFVKYLPEAEIPDRRILSGRILDSEVAKVEANMKVKVEGGLATGQCDGWKNISKKAVIGTMITIDYTPYLIHTHDVTGDHKTAANLLALVEADIKHCKEVLGVDIITWCSDAGGDSRAIRQQLYKKMPELVQLDCWAHQVNENREIK
ncbi:hypothetical protein BV22DRAFT_1026973 [Leucogyrophana mollusca]|uniref:Uncharacterized protein n=1 Tax=Leucogyrophana mollusca TaxID=85980 RepID=A0ACB8AV21_9AGAM|nr:hypothetical protein BV22DRAFT_1026973 [Leucogyrophana mollusca]